MKRYFFATVLAFLVVVLPGRDAIRASGLSYTIEDLGDIGGLVPTVTGMNVSGQVSGYVNAASGPRAVRFTSGIGWEYLPGVATYSLAMAINASGDVAGYHLTPAGLRAFRYMDGGGVTTIAPLPGGSFAVGFGINARGEVTGYGNTPSGTRGWRAAPGLPPVMLPTLGGNTGTTCGINDAGQIVGSATTASNHTHAYRIEPDNSVTDIVPFSGPTGTGRACAIDADGRVGGGTTSGSADRAFRFDAGAPVNLDTFASTQSSVAAIANGVSVGSFIAATNGASNAFVHTDETGSVNLNDLLASDSGWRLATASAVNTAGQIAGNGSLNGAARAFRLTPVAPDTTAPVISAVSATPSNVWPPNGQLVDVTVSVTATDNVDPAPVCNVSSLSATGGTADDFSFAGLAARVRAIGGTTYTLNVTCADAAGNVSPASSTDVVVPPDTTAPVISAVSATPSNVWPPNGQLVDVTVSVTATDNVDPAPVCNVSSLSATGGTADDFSFAGLAARVRAIGGTTYTLNVTCTDAAGNSTPGSTSVVVPPDTTAPVITEVSSTPSTVWPPNGELVDVAVAVTATDDSGSAPVCSLSSLRGIGPRPDGSSITGPLSARVRAVGGRTYTLHVTCVDAAGNSTPGSTSVVVPPDTTAPVIMNVQATPDAIWPPNGKMVPVTVSVNATDDVDSAPQCYLTSVSGGSSNDAVKTGRFTADVRSEKNADGSVRVYSLTVECSDAAGNKSQGVATVVVGKDSAAVTAFLRASVEKVMKQLKELQRSRGSSR